MGLRKSDNITVMGGGGETTKRGEGKTKRRKMMSINGVMDWF